MSTLHWAGLLSLAVLAGAVVPFQSTLNVNLGRGLGHPLWATLVSLLVSISVLIPVLLALRLPLPDFSYIASAPWWVWFGGAFGVCFVALAVILMPRLGASGFVALALTGQIIASLTLDHFGLLGLSQRPITMPQLLGALMLVGGVALIQLSATTQPRPPTQPVQSNIGLTGH